MQKAIPAKTKLRHGSPLAQVRFNLLHALEEGLALGRRNHAEGFIDFSFVIGIDRFPKPATRCGQLQDDAAPVLRKDLTLEVAALYHPVDDDGEARFSDQHALAHGGLAHRAVGLAEQIEDVELRTSQAERGEKDFTAAVERIAQFEEADHQVMGGCGHFYFDIKLNCVNLYAGMKIISSRLTYFQFIRRSTSLLAVLILVAPISLIAQVSAISTDAAPAVTAPVAPTAAAPLTAPKPPAPDTDPDTETHKNIEYAKVGDTSLLLDLYLPKDRAKPVPLVIWIHGGGWSQGSKERPGLSAVVKSGMALASINYRLSQQAIFPAQLYDCKAAVRFLRAHAADFQINPDKIAVAGESAGGHLAALLGTTGREAATEGDEGNPTISSQVSAVVDFYGPTDLVAADFTVPTATPIDDPRMIMMRMALTSALLGGDPATKVDEAHFASPIYHISATTCPFFIAHGDKDTLVPVEQSTTFDAALKKAGIESDLVIVPGKNHGFHDFKVSQEAVAFLQQKLGS
jgi:acetyl esterase/lipase